MFKLKRKLIMVMLVMIGVTAFTSCEKDELNDNSKEKTVSVSEWHDKALKSFLESNQIDSTTSRKIVRQEIINFLCEENPALFNKEELSKSATFFETSLKNQSFNSFKSTNSLNISENALILTDYLIEQKYISIELGIGVKNIYKNFGMKDADSILEMVNKLKSNNWTENDIKFLNNFADIFNSSYVFWQLHFNSTTSTKMSNKEAALMVCGADAVGALYGSIIPFWGSIVEGALFSAIAILNVE